MSSRLGFFLILFIQSSIFSAVTYGQEQQSLGQVVLVEGSPQAVAGRLLFLELDPGSRVKVNLFSQYRGSTEEKTAKAEVRSGAQYRLLKPGDALPGIGEIIDTGDGGQIRLLFVDDSIVDLGPNTLFAVQKFDMADKERHIVLRILQGKARILVVRKLQGQSTYRVASPGVNTWVRGTDFAVHVDLGSSDRVLTHVLGIRGQVTVEFARNTKGGEVYHQPVVVNTYSLLSLQSAEGYVLSHSLNDRMPMSDYSSAIDTHTPLTDPLATPLGRSPRVGELLGAGDGYTESKEIVAHDHRPLLHMAPYFKSLGPWFIQRPPTEILRISSPDMIKATR
jgi:hypothetical protein